MSKVIERSISKELKKSYLAYAMSVIVGRAIPDARDGLKPVQRRIIYAMNEMSLYRNKPHKKSARIVGEVLGKYHPHGDMAVYAAMVRMAQDFSLRYCLIDGQGNFGSVDGDPPAAQRYTEARLSKIAAEMTVDLNKNTVDFMPNYDNSLKEPVVLPSKIPNLLINGASGIAVGMATNIPSHNLSEVLDGLNYLIDNEKIGNNEVEIKDLMQFIKGPDFPTAGKIINAMDIYNIYKTGRGSVYIRANYDIEENKKGKKRLVFTDLPYKVNKSNLLSHVARLVNTGVLKGITDLRDESNKEGIRIVFELSRDVEPEYLVNNIFKHTELEISFGVNLLVLNKNKPILMNLKQLLDVYLDHRFEVTKRWLTFDIEKLKNKLHILEGLMIAIDNLDETIAIIKSSKDPKTAKQRLMERFKLDEAQSQAILDLKLQKLTGMEIDSLKTDYNETKALMEKYLSILTDNFKLWNLIKEEFAYIKKTYGDGRKTELLNVRTTKDLNFREFVENKRTVVLLTEKGYIKRMLLEEYHTQHRAGRGITAVKLDEDEVKEFVISNIHDILYLFTNTGRLFTMDCYNVPEAGRNAKGRFLANYLKLNENEKITNVISFNPEEFENIDNKYLSFVTRYGKIKKLSFKSVAKVRSNGLRVITLNENDSLVSVKMLEENKKILITSFAGKCVLFDPDRLRALGRTAMGVKAMNVGDSEIVSVNIVANDDKLLFVSKKGYGKKTNVSEFRETNRGTKGIIAMNVKTAGGIVKSLIVGDSEEIMLITDKGIMIRIPLTNIPLLRRNTKGVKLIKLKEKDFVHNVETLEKEEDSNVENEINNDKEIISGTENGD